MGEDRIHERRANPASSLLLSDHDVEHERLVDSVAQDASERGQPAVAIGKRNDRAVPEHLFDVRSGSSARPPQIVEPANELLRLA